MAATLQTQEEAETLALRAVAFLAERPREFLRFAELTGQSVEQIRGRVGDPALLGAVLDYLLFSDALVREFAAAAEVEPEAPRRARALLPGRPAPA